MKKSGVKLQQYFPFPALLFVSLFFLTSPVFGKLVQGSDSKMDNHTSVITRGFFSKKHEIFFRAINNSVKTHSHSHDNYNICLKEHKIKKRDAREDESILLKKKGEKNMEKEKLFGSDGGDGGEDYEDFPIYGQSKETFDTSGKCSSCHRDKMRVKSLETIKDSILSKLGMSQPPNVTERPKPKIADHLLMMLLKKKHPHHTSNGVYWILQEEDLEEMQGDEPYDSHYSEKGTGKSSNFSGRNNNVRPRGNASDNKFIDSIEFEFQEGEILMEEEDDYHIRTERILAFSQPHPRIRHFPHVQFFEFSDRLRMSKVKKALLWIYVKGKGTSSVAGNKITISIYKILNAGRPGARESPVITSVKVDSTQSIPSGSGAWISMEYTQIKNLVADWFKNPLHNQGIVINAEDDNRTNLAVIDHSGKDSDFVPFLEVYVTENRKHRTKRTVGLNCKDSSKETRCCRYPLTVDFVEFGWDWIIAPKKYEAFYCAGECPLAFLPQHPHTHVSQLANSPGNGPCCAPRKLSELEMLYFDQNLNIIFGRIPAMKVDRCGCT